MPSSSYTANVPKSTLYRSSASLTEYLRVPAGVVLLLAHRTSRHRGVAAQIHLNGEDGMAVSGLTPNMAVGQCSSRVPTLMDRVWMCARRTSSPGDDVQVGDDVGLQ